MERLHARIVPGFSNNDIICDVTLGTGREQMVGSGRLKVSEIKVLCDRVSDVRLLGRMQMITSGDDRWRRLSRQELVIEAAAMGVAPLDPSRCYVIARAGPAAEGERRAFEVRDFTSNTERTSVFVIGRAYDAP